MKFRGKGQIPWLGLKFRDLWVTVGPTYNYDYKYGFVLEN